MAVGPASPTAFECIGPLWGVIQCAGSALPVALGGSGRIGSRRRSSSAAVFPPWVAAWTRAADPPGGGSRAEEQASKRRIGDGDSQWGLRCCTCVGQDWVAHLGSVVHAAACVPGDQLDAAGSVACPAQGCGGGHRLICAYRGTTVLGPPPSSVPWWVDQHDHPDREVRSCRAQGIRPNTWSCKLT
ncbi:hypothetical protein NDU88_003376 [Pleurodeles waltl]|uniref:Uncharacterized protein n=1 Tax=Pleurodeles waltl TaxID=8319 RepID=A0AAV7QFA1_PLEWA|nr:hypothetical protein NDU88_003376 [Pleurodeles waltl]